MASSAPRYLRVKPNTGDLTTYEFVDLPYRISSDYKFPTQLPTGTLTASITNTITLTPVPYGVNGADTGHYLYIATCSGGAQKVLITGGTAVGGTSSGTITFVPTNSCNAGWDIQSATAGIAEAFWAGTNNGTVLVPSGTHAIYAPIIMNPTTSAKLLCYDWSAVLSAATATGNVVEMIGGGHPAIEGCKITASVTRTADAAIKVGTGSDNYDTYTMDHLHIDNMYNGIDWESGYIRKLTNSYLGGSISHYGMLIKNAVNADDGDDVVSNNQIETNSATSAIRHESASGLRLINNKIISCVDYAYDLSANGTGATGVINIENNSIECGGEAQIRLSTGASATASSGRIVIGSNEIGGPNPAKPSITAYGYSPSINVGEVVITGNFLINHVRIGANTSNVLIANNMFNCAGDSTNYAVETAAATARISVMNNHVISGSVGAYRAAASTVVVDNGNWVYYADLGAWANGSVIANCIDCKIQASCTNGSNGAMAKRLNNAWVCN